MKIRDKLFLSFGLYVFFAAVLGAFAYKELSTIGTRLLLVEAADDITNTILEVRRYEKNYFLYRSKDDLQAVEEHLGLLKTDIDSLKAEIVGEMGQDNYDMIRNSIGRYERMISAATANYQSQQELADSIKARGKIAELALSEPRHDAFTALRRHESNIMRYRDQEAFRTYARAVEAARLADVSEVQSYLTLFRSLFSLYEQEETVSDDIRQTARRIQAFTESLSKRERMDIETILTMSRNLLLVAIALIIVIGTVVNFKLATSIATPIRTLEKISRKIARGDFSERIEVKGNDELASLELAFNHMEEKLVNAMWSLEHAIEKLRDKQARLVEAEKLAAVGKLAAGIAHEINNPLTSVLTFSNLMMEQCPPEDPRHDKLKLMARETARARNIVRQLLNFGREIIIKPEWININQPVMEIIDSLSAQDAFAGIELKTDLSESLHVVHADPAQIGQVVLNMLLNAIHSIAPPGVIEVATREQEGSVELVIADSGVGIPPDHLNKIFEPFFTTKEMTKGTGLGLAVSYGIIKKHDGDIAVSSEEGKGTTFIVRLPIYG